MTHEQVIAAQKEEYVAVIGDENRSGIAAGLRSVDTDLLLRLR